MKIASLLLVLLYFGHIRTLAQVVLAADKMNVLYLGVDNPLSVAVTGETDSISLTAELGTITRLSQCNYKYVYHHGKCPTDSMKAHITLRAYWLDSMVLEQIFTFRLLEIETEVVLGAGPSKRGGTMGDGEFKAQRGLAGIVTCCGFDARCNVNSYQVTFVRGNELIGTSINKGGAYTPETLALIMQAKSGDRYYYSNIYTQCPGICGPKRRTDMAFTIK
jgi:hypothetical protein